jgi:hypothetical protein
VSLFRSKKFIAGIVVLVVLVFLVLPAFVAFRYTAPGQRGDFARHPWRAWSFAYAVLAVPGNSRLKTSGMALRKADWLFKGTVVDPTEVQLLFTPEDRPFTLRHDIDGRTVSTTVTPSYRFVWQVQGVIDTVSGQSGTVVALLDYATGHVLYDVRDDLLPSELPARTSSPSPRPPG